MDEDDREAAIVELFWEWYWNTSVELWDKNQKQRFNDDAERMAARLGITYNINPRTKDLENPAEGKRS